LLARVRAHERLASILKGDEVMLWCFLIILYTTVISCLVEFCEQNRFKFLIEQVVWVFIAVVLFRAVAWRNGRTLRARQCASVTPQSFSR